MSLRLILFDLDGTLADTAPDIARATNLALAEVNRPPLPLERVRSIVSSGARALIRAGLDDPSPEDDAIEPLVRRLFDFYLDRPAAETSAFTGLPEVIGEVGKLGTAWGVVTNKPERLARPIIDALAFNPAPGWVIGGDSLPTRKPDPMPLLAACRSAGVKPAEAIYVGDAAIDVQAARAAGMPVIIVGFGYAPGMETVRSWKPDAIAPAVADLRRMLVERIAAAA